MPRGRNRQTPHVAKLDSEKRILEALAKAGPRGLRFSELREETNLHQDTLTERLRALRGQRKVAQDDAGRYVIVALGLEDLALSNLQFLIEELGPSHATIGGPQADSAFPVDRAVMRSSVFYTIPPLPDGSMKILRRTLHEEYAALTLLSLCSILGVSLSDVLDGPRRAEILERLTQTSFRGKQILACVIDGEVLRRELTPDYLKRIVQVAAAVQLREGIALVPAGPPTRDDAGVAR